MIVAADLNEGTDGPKVFLGASFESSFGAPITDIQVFAGDNGSFPVQDGYNMILKDLNKGAGGKYIYVGYTKSTSVGPPVTSFTIAQSPDRYHAYPPRDMVRVDQDCQEGTGGWYSYISLQR